MIPLDLDDGFTVEIAPDLFCRPMLTSDRVGMQSRADHDIAGEISRPPYTFGSIPKRLEEEVVLTVLTNVNESSLFNELSRSVELQVRNPGMSNLHCDLCRTYAVDHTNGEIQFDQLGRPKPIPGGLKVPCESGVGCVKGKWANPCGMSNSRWARTWRHFWRYRHDQEFRLASDPIFRRNLLLLNWTVDYGRDPAFDPFIG